MKKKAGSTLSDLRRFEWKHRNLIILFVSLLIAYWILRFRPITGFLEEISYLGYTTAFPLGMFFTFAFTTAPATAVIYNLGKTLNPFFLAFIGAFGSVISDYIIFRFVRNRLAQEIKLLSKEINSVTEPISDLVTTKRMRHMIWRKISRSRFWKTMVPVVAGLIIASPLPDELGVAIFGAAKYNPRNFIIISYFLNFIGILAIGILSRF